MKPKMTKAVIATLVVYAIIAIAVMLMFGVVVFGN
jgi:hypothetical protein